MRLNLRNSTTQKWVLSVGILFGIVYAYWNFVYVPRGEQAVAMEKDIQTETEMLAKGKRIAANYQTVQEDYGRMMESWKIAQELLPTQKEMEGLLKSVALEGQSTTWTSCSFGR